MTEPLPLASVIGFAGTVPDGLIAHPDGETVVYPLGSTVVLRSKQDSGKQEFLRGHSHEVRDLLLAPALGARPPMSGPKLGSSLRHHVLHELLPIII